MNYGEMKTYIRDYVQRTDLSNTLFDTWVEMVRARLRRDMRIVNLDLEVQMSNPAGDVVYPVDSNLIFNMQDLLSVSLDASSVPDGFNKVLQAVSYERFIEVQAEGQVYGITEPEVYCMFSSGFKVAPGDQSDFVFNVVFRTADNNMTTDTQATVLLTFASAVYIDAILIEVYKYLRDPEGEAAATARYNVEVNSYQQYYDWQHSGQNAISKGAWSWV